MSDAPPRSEVDQTSAIEGGLDQAMSEALLRLDRVDEEQQRLLADARRQVAELHIEATRARAAATKAARQVVADAEAEAASLVRAAHDQAARMSAESEKESQVIAQSFLAGVRKTRDDTLAAARAEADHLRQEAARARDSVIEAAYHQAARILREAEQVADEIRRPCSCGVGLPGTAEREGRPTGEPATTVEEPTSEPDHPGVAPPWDDEMRTLMVKMERAVDALVQAASIERSQPMVSAWDETARASDERSAEVSAAPDQGSMPLIGSRGQRWSSPAPPSGDAGDAGSRVTARPPAMSHPRANGSGGVRPVTKRGWRSREQ